MRGLRAQFTPAEQAIAAVWIFKTVLLWQLTAEPERAAQAAEYEWFYRHRVPLPDTRIWVGAFSGPDLLTYRHHGFALHRVDVPPTVDDPRAYCVTFSVGGFAAHVFTLSLEPRSRSVALDEPPLDRGGALFDWMLPIWPTQTPSRWPPDDPLSREKLLTIADVWLR
jgi:hypothetical protein